MPPLPSKVKPVFADDVVVSFIVKRSKDGKRVDSAIRLSFIDSMRKEVIAEVVISPVTADALSKILEGSLKRLDQAVEGKTRKREETTTYIG